MGLPSFLISNIILLLICLLNNVFTIISTAPLKEETLLFGGNFPALYVIGDSLVDPRNNNYLLTLVRANFSPYGSHFDEDKATGCFNDGKTIADYIAMYYGLPLTPAYMRLSRNQKNNISTGISYVSASCGIFPDSGKKLGRCLLMSVQVYIFNKTIEKNLKKNFKTESELSSHLAKSLFLTVIGVNDYAFSYDKKTHNANEFANRLLHEFMIQIKRLHKLGARKFFIKPCDHHFQ